MNHFQKKVEALFPNFEVFWYKECPEGALYGDDYRPWVEFDLRQITKSHQLSACHVPVASLAKLMELFGTKDITVAGFDLSADGTDFVGYVLASGVKFPKKSKKRRRS